MPVFFCRPSEVRERMLHTNRYSATSVILVSRVGIISILISSNSYLRLSSSYRVSCKPAVGKISAAGLVSLALTCFISYIYPAISATAFLAKRMHLSQFAKHENVDIREMLGMFSP
ncbi:hypothetical protein K443DRAFT_383665 [Laccaria amethystina LaAM-08-1]|uniref:Uncharacterized protein n=1 Tax=Laccaria amethystina LaAM-08-1 TaxID=1095629 RepID=A0A0C9WIV6_9AGAR|nr:hypothetical protein K443DRAFT_383665 [Laccaria amethystina LaAM-08-1]